MQTLFVVSGSIFLPNLVLYFYFVVILIVPIHGKWINCDTPLGRFSSCLRHRDGLCLGLRIGVTRVDSEGVVVADISRIGPPIFDQAVCQSWHGFHRIFKAQ